MAQMKHLWSHFVLHRVLPNDGIKGDPLTRTIVILSRKPTPMWGATLVYLFILSFSFVCVSLIFLQNCVFSFSMCPIYKETERQRNCLLLPCHGFSQLKNLSTPEVILAVSYSLKFNTFATVGHCSVWTQDLVELS